MQKVQEAEGLEAQTGFRGKRGTIDGLFSLCVALQKRKEHNLATWGLFIDLVKAFDTVSREALFAVLRKFGMPDHFISIVMRLHTGAVMKFKIGEVDSTVPSEIGVRQGSCEGPTLFLFIIQAALETMIWLVEKPQFCTTKDGKITGSRWNRKRDVTVYELWASLFADDCALLFNSREDLVIGANYLFHHLRKFGLLMHIGIGDIASKTEAMFFPAPRQAHSSGDQTNFSVAHGFVTFTNEFKYLGSLVHYTLTSDADIAYKIDKATAAFGALRENFFSNRLVNPKEKGQVYVTLCLTILLYGSESWCVREDLFRRMRNFHNTCVRAMCRVNRLHTRRHRITSAELYQRLGIKSLDSYYNGRLLRWAGHVARMPMTRTPRRLLTGWVNHRRLVGAPQTTFGRTLNKALAASGLPTHFSGARGWQAAAQDRASWRTKTRPQ